MFGKSFGNAKVEFGRYGGKNKSKADTLEMDS